MAGHHRLPQHASDHGAAAPAAARSSTNTGAFADLLERLGAGLNGLDHDAFADLVAQTGGLEALDDRLLFGFLFLIVDGNSPTLSIST